MWHDFLENRFVKGLDEEFEYVLVDDNDEYDILGGKDAEDAWFDDEEPSWQGSGFERGTSEHEGETGVQDF